jgi:hypothetical protein
MGGFGAASVRINGNGEVRLAGHPAGAVRGAPSQSDLRADVRSSGMAICAAFGVDPAGAPAPPSIPPGLVVTMRSMASGAMGPAADRAQGALREMASALLAPDRQAAAQTELATRAGGREMPSITPFLPKTEAPAPAPYVPPTPVEDTPRPTAVSYDAPPRVPEPKPPAPPTPSPYAPYTPPPEPAPAPPSTFAPIPVPFPTNPPSPGTAAPTSADRSPFGTDPAAPTPYATSAPPPSSTTVPPPPPSSTVPPTPSPYGTNAPAPGWSTPPTPSPFATNAPAPAGSTPPTPSPFATNAPAPAGSTPPTPSPFATNAPAPAAPAPPAATPFSTNAPASWETSAPATTPPAPAPLYEEPARPAGYAKPPPPAPSYEEVVVAPTPPAATSQTWTPVATPAWTPGDPANLPAVDTAGETRVPTVPPPTPARTSSVARPAYREPRDRPAWLVPAAIGVAVLLLLLIVGGLFLRSRPTSTPGPIAHASPSPKASPKASPTATGGGPRAVPTYAPASAPPVTSVTFLPDTVCSLGGRCTVDVEMKYSPAQSGTLGYKLEFFDRCTGTTKEFAGRSFKPSAAFARADPGFQTITLPTGVKSAALVAVSTTPAAAASAPLLLGSETC